MVEGLTLERIVVVAPNWLGDAVMALPAVAALRTAWPGAALVAAGRSSTVPLFSMVPGIDEVVRLDNRGGVVGAISWAEDAAALRGARAGLAILLPNSFRSAWTAQRAGIVERWGYAADLRGRLLTRAVPRLRQPYHMAEYYLHLARQLTGVSPGSGLADREAASGVGQGSSLADREAASGVGQGSSLVDREAASGVGQGSSLVDREAVSGVGHGSSLARTAVLPRLRVPDEARQRASEVLARAGLPGDALLVGMAPGAAYGKAKQWPPERFAALAIDLHRRVGATTLLFGAAADRKTTRIIARIAAGALAAQSPGRHASPSSRAPAVVDLAGQTDLPLLVALMARCRSIVSNDSGAMHVAAAAGVPVTAVFGATNEHHTSPLPSEAPGIAPHEILTSAAWCRPCMLRECPIDHRCMRRIEPAAVAAAVERQIGQM